MRTLLQLTATALVRRISAGAVAVAALLCSPFAAAAPSPPGIPIVNTAIVSFKDSSGNIFSLQSNTVRTLVSGDITFRIQDEPDPVWAGGAISYTLTIANNRAYESGPITVSGPLPGNTEFVSAGQGGVLENGRITWLLDSMPPGSRISLALVLESSPNIPDGQDVVFQAAAQAQGLNLTAEARTAVQGRTPGLIQLQNANGEKAASYMTGDKVCVFVADADRNADPAAADTLTVVLSHSESGDAESVIAVETGASTGEFRICLGSAPGAAIAGDGQIQVTPDSTLTATYTDEQDPHPGVSASALIDPRGVVFDSRSGDPVPGARVTLIDNATGLASSLPQPPDASAPQPNPVVTGPDGAFAFPAVPQGSYSLLVQTGDSFVFPSKVPDAELPSQYVISQGSRGEPFALPAGHTPLNLDIPVDPYLVRNLVVTKTASRETASTGDSIAYLVTISNYSSLPVTQLRLVDVMPHGFVYRPGSSYMDGAAIADPLPGGVRSVVWTLDAPLSPGDARSVTYTVVVGPDSERGDGRNTAQAQGSLGGESIVSNRATHVIKISEGVFTRRGSIVGSVFVDSDGNGIFNADEQGVENVIIYLEDGTWVRTDSDGRFSLNGVPPGTHVLRLDEASVPNEYIPSQTQKRFAGSNRSQFADLSPSGIANADFALEPVDGEGAAAVSFNGDPDHLAILLEPDQKSQPAGPAAEPAPEPLEKQLQGLSPSLGILSPENGAVLDRSQTSIRIKAPLDTVPALFVNGEPVPQTRIGKTVRNPVDSTSGFEYIGVKLERGQDNEIRAILKNARGETMEETVSTVAVVGNPVKIIIEADRTQAPANGTSAITGRIIVHDGAGRVVKDPGLITIETTAGGIMTLDADPSLSGIQIAAENGEAPFSVRTPMDTGSAEIIARAHGLEQRLQVAFTPNLRDRFAVGYVDVVFGAARSSGNVRFLDDNGILDRGNYMNAHTAVFLKKNIGRNTLLTTSFNSRKSGGYDMFRSTNKQHDAEAYYPLYGDNSSTGYDAVSQNEFYFKLERDKSSVLFGDFKADITGTLLSNYTRSFNGFQANLDNGSYNLNSFVSSTTQTRAVDTLPGNGTAGYYHLTQTPMLDGSDHVTLETRDRNDPQRILDRKVMTRWVDYTMDYETGALLFKEPVPGRDRDFNPVFIIVHYETSGGDERFYTYGARGSLNLSTKLALGFTGIIEEQQAADTRLMGLDAHYKIADKLSLKAETASTRSLIGGEPGASFQSGGAWAMQLDYTPAAGTALSAFARKSSLAFNNPSSTDLPRGETRYGFDIRHALSPSVSLFGQYLDITDRLNHGAHRFALAGVRKKTSRGSLSFEYFRSATGGRAIAPPGISSSVLFDNYDERPESMAAVRVSAERTISPKLTVTASHQQEFDNRYNRSSVGVNFKVTPMTRMYVAVERDEFSDRADQRTLIGVNASVTDTTTAYNEYRIENGSDGASVQQVIGIRNAFKIRPGFTGNIALENLQTRSGEERRSEADGFSVSLGLEYLRRDNFSLSGRFERGNTSGNDTFFTEGGLKWKFGPGSSLLLRKRYYRHSIGEQGIELRDRMLFGIAHRAGASADIFAKFILDNQKNTSLPAAQNEKNRIFSLETIFHVNRNLQVTAKYAGKWSDQAGNSTFTGLIATRVLYDLSGRLQIGGDLRLLTSRSLGIGSTGGSLEAAYTLISNLQLGIGYSFDAFDTDLTGDSYWGKGYYMRLRYKIDQ